jgi:hypothetical protein
MNVERMHAVAKRLANDLQRTNLPELVAQLHSALTNAVNSPQDANQQNQVATLRAQVEAALEASEVDTFSPLEVQVLREWGVTHLLGAELRDALDQAFVGNQITLATASEQLGEFVQPLSELNQQLGSLLESLGWFKIESEDLEPGQFEIDILIPRSAVRNELGALGDEFKQLQALLLPFVELATASRPAIEVQTIGSSDFTVFLMAAPAAAACVAKAVEKVLDVYKKIVDIRLVKAQIEGLDLDAGGNAVAAAAEPLEQYANSMMATEVGRIAAEVVAEFAHTDLPNGRPNELEVEVSRSLLQIAGRIDDSYNISVRTGPLPLGSSEDEEGGEDSSQVEDEVTSFAREVQAGRDAMQFMNLTGTPILSLEDGDESSGGEPATGD